MPTSTGSASERVPTPTSPQSKPLSLLVVMNGSLADKSASVGGGDIVMFKFIRLSNLEPDLLLPRSAQPFVTTRGRLFLTMKNLRPTLPGILTLFPLRILQGIWRALRNRHQYDVALASSPYSVDVIPVWFWKARHRGAVIFHILPKRKAVNLTTRIRFAIAALEQQISMKLLGWACDFIVAGNEYTKGQLQEILPGKKFVILDAGIDAAAMDRVPAPARDPNLACFIGRLTSQKGIFDLLKVMAALRQTHPDFRLIMVGSGPEKEFLLAEKNRLGLDNITLSGFISEEEKIALLKKSGYFFFPSYEEGWGIALAEALYCECRCICYELPHYRFIFQDYPVYARLGDPDDFVRAFRQSGAVSPEQKPFLRRYDDPLVVRRLVEHLGTIARA